MAPLLLFALSMTGLAGCKGPDDSQGPAVALAVTPGSVTLTYICGNSFRVRNTNATSVTITWDVYQTTEKGTLTLAPKPAGVPYSETYFTTAKKGTVRLFESGTLIQTKANGNKPVCQLPSDTTKPGIPPFGMPYDTGYVAPAQNADGTIYFRRLFAVVFEPTATGPTINAVLTKYGATIVGGLPSTGAYVVQVADPGPTINEVTQLRGRINAEPGVKYVLLVPYSTGNPRVNMRTPIDGQGFDRQSWADPGTVSTWALKAIRAQQAWGCEVGREVDRVKVGVLEWNADTTKTDLRPSHPTTFTACSPVYRWHPHRVLQALPPSPCHGAQTYPVL